MAISVVVAVYGSESHLQFYSKAGALSSSVKLALEFGSWMDLVFCSF